MGGGSIRQLHKALRRLKEPNPEDKSTLADFTVALGRHIRNGAGYQCGLLDQFSITKVLNELESVAAAGKKRSSADHPSQVRPRRGTTSRTSRPTTGPPRDHVFVSYSHRDEKWLKELQDHLRPYKRNKSVTVWSDKDITPGDQWFGEIEKALASTKIAVLLVTTNFLASEFITRHELAPLLKEAKAGNVHIIWIPVGPCSYQETDLRDYQAAIDPAKPLSKMEEADRDEAWVNICKVIKEAIGR